MKKRQRVIRISNKEEQEVTRLFWRDRSPEERLDAVEFLREQYYIIRGYKTAPRIVKELHLVERWSFILISVILSRHLTEVVWSTSSSAPRKMSRHRDLADLELLGEKV
jgi:hypothetical protein